MIFFRDRFNSVRDILGGRKEIFSYKGRISSEGHDKLSLPTPSLGPNRQERGVGVVVKI